jgi:histidyl-tRNA synthetase
MAAPRNASRKFQAPKGTRDFYPQDMAVRRYIESVWRKVSINHGFDEVEGPTFEDLELYTHKSGPGIVSEIFQVYSGKDQDELARIRGGADAPFALRPEFTPTLARMVAAKAAELPRPIKWFAIPSHFRAERPQRGRLREFIQWNVDFIGDDSPRADAEVIGVAIASLDELGLASGQVRVGISSRGFAHGLLRFAGIPEADLHLWFDLMDRADKLNDVEYLQQSIELGQSVDTALRIRSAFRMSTQEIMSDLQATFPEADSSLAQSQLDGAYRELEQSFTRFGTIVSLLNESGFDNWTDWNPRIVRGLAYYTGTVFEIHESSGAERAIAGGGRYDNLIESFGGPSLPACGFGMGDVVLANILHDKGLLPENVYMKPLRPHAFAIAATDEAEPIMRKAVAQLRRDGFHVRHSYKTTRNVGKLLGDASKSRAMSAIIFGKDVLANQVDFKDLQSGEQTPIAIDDLKQRLKDLITRNE